MSPLLTPTTLVRTAEGINRFGQVDISEVQEVRVDGEWLPIEEFTGCAGLATVTAVAPPADARSKFTKKKRVKSAVESFLGEEDDQDLTLDDEANPPAAAAPKPPATMASPAPAPAAAPAPTHTGMAESTLRITEDVAAALMSGYAVNVRGILLEPTFQKKRVSVPFQEGAPMATAPVQPAQAPVNVAAAVAGVVPAMGSMTESVSLDAPQPAPSAPVQYQRRFELGRMSAGQTV